MSTSFASRKTWPHARQPPASASFVPMDDYAAATASMQGAAQQSMAWGQQAGFAGDYDNAATQDAFASNGAVNTPGYFQPRDRQDPRAYTQDAHHFYNSSTDPSTSGIRQVHPEMNRYGPHNELPVTNSSHYPAALPTHGASSAYMSTSPDAMSQHQFDASSFMHQGFPTAPGLHGASKRMRSGGTDDEYHDEADDEDRDAARARPQGACARCKGLKVKCEFRSESEPCKRCLNAGQECMIPGRKKRRTPPKREHLLNEIRAQAEHIKTLMAQLEQVGQTPRSYAGSSSAHTSPMISPSSFSESDVTSPQESVNPAVEEWIARARERFAEFDDFISVAGSAPISYVVQDDPEHSDEDSEGAEYDFTVVPADGATSESFSRHLSSALPPAPKKRDSGQKLATLPSEAAPYGLMANLSLKAHPRRANSTGEMASPEEGKDLSIANDDFFRSSPGPDPERARQAMTVERPPILTRGIITPAEAESLFKIYFDTMNQSVSLLDPVLYTAPKTCYRSPFLFTVICALASRFHPKQPEIYPQLMRYAHLAAGTALISGPKTVDLCHAFILLALYPTPAKRWEDDRSWIFLGTAIRIAMDLNLQYPNTAKPQNENHAREMLNRTRVWINCYNLDRSMGSQYGKAPVIYQEDYMATHSQDWWQSNPYNMANFDIHLCAYNAELRALSGFIRKVYSNPDHPTGLNKEVDLEKLSMETDDEIQALSAKWMGIIEQTDMDDPQNRFRTGLLRLAWSYARLAVLSYGFQHAFGKNNADENPFLLRCFTAAKDVVTAVVDGLGQSSQRIYLRHGPEAQKVFVTFAASFLVKLLQPKFASYLSYERRLEIRQLVKSVIDFLASPDIAVDEQHGPKLHSRFLKGLLASPLAQVFPPTNRTPKSAQASPMQESQPIAASSPESAGILTPAPNQAATSFDMFTATNPFSPVQPVGVAGNADFSMDDLFNPPLPGYDDAIFQSMQTLSQPVQWQDITSDGGSDWFSQISNSNPQVASNTYGQYWPTQ